MELENLSMTEEFIKMNKHNHITATYYLLLKKLERETGKNLVFERVTKDKRCCNSTGNLGQASSNSLQSTALYFRGYSQQKSLPKHAIMNKNTTSKEGITKVVQSGIASTATT